MCVYVRVYVGVFVGHVSVCVGRRMYVCVCVCLCVCVCGWVGGWLHVCVCVCVNKRSYCNASSIPWSSGAQLSVKLISFGGLGVWM